MRSFPRVVSDTGAEPTRRAINPMPVSALPKREGLSTIAVDLGGAPERWQPSLTPRPCQVPIATGKAGNDVMTKGSAVDSAHFGVHLNAAGPGDDPLEWQHPWRIAPIEFHPALERAHVARAGVGVSPVRRPRGGRTLRGRDDR